MPATVRSFVGKPPVIGRGVFLAETCAVIGDVVIGERVVDLVRHGRARRRDADPDRRAHVASRTTPSFT